jgi:hypothetical protein
MRLFQDWRRQSQGAVISNLIAFLLNPIPIFNTVIAFISDNAFDRIIASLSAILQFAALNHYKELKLRGTATSQLNSITLQLHYS